MRSPLLPRSRGFELLEVGTLASTRANVGFERAGMAAG